MARLRLLDGPAGTSREVMERFAQFSSLFGESSQRPVELVLSPRLAWQLRLKERHAHRDRPGERQVCGLNARLSRFIEVYPQTVGNLPVRPAVVW